MGIADYISLALVTVVWFLACMILTVVLHEIGHLIGGLLSGYRLSGFAVGGIILRRQNGRFGWHKYPLGSLNWGQCFMYGEEDSSPGMLVTGGCAMNIILGLVFSVIALVTIGLDEKGVWRLMFLAVPASVNMVMGLANLLSGSVTSDGNTLKEVKKDDGKRMYNRTMMITAELLDGKSYSEMKAELFRYSGKSSLAEEIKMYGFYRKFEECNTSNGYKRILKDYGFGGKPEGYFAAEKETESEIARAVFSKTQESHIGKVPADGRELLLMVARDDTDADQVFMDFERKCPMPGLAKSALRCWENIKEIRKERS